ncbi:MAG: nucleotidyltransferase domain-containing protein, partial [Sphaerochaetaceae bacterium]|nr:nucleotidyltransferase domain-containing protein [Sphaerochaetaceae bacterium]
YLFGSRVDSTKKGGDIDLLVVSKKLEKKDIRTLRIEFCKNFGEQKIDILLDDGSLKKTFHKLIFQKAIQL